MLTRLTTPTRASPWTRKRTRRCKPRCRPSATPNSTRAGNWRRGTRRGTRPSGSAAPTSPTRHKEAGRVQRTLPGPTAEVRTPAMTLNDTTIRTLQALVADGKRRRPDLASRIERALTVLLFREQEYLGCGAYSIANERGSAYTVTQDRKSTRLNSSHANISYAVFCLKKKKTQLMP